jgi:cytochrome oxidase Cu insertion factor (SCO1/SenC/PrrC family)
MTSPVPPAAARGHRTLIAVAAAFAAPLVAAFWLYYGGGWHPTRTTNRGELIEPARPLPELALRDADGAPVAAELLRGRWTVLYVGSGACDPACRRVLYLTRQTRLALNKDVGRVQRVFIATADCCDRRALAADHPDLTVLTADAGRLARWLGAIPPASATDAGSSGLFLVDPLGNLMMRYPPDAPDKALLDDLTRLLKLSHIG